MMMSVNKSSLEDGTIKTSGGGQTATILGEGRKSARE
jgi:hypothetical protein